MSLGLWDLGPSSLLHSLVDLAGKLCVLRAWPCPTHLCQVSCGAVLRCAPPVAHPHTVGALGWFRSFFNDSN